MARLLPSDLRSHDTSRTGLSGWRPDWRDFWRILSLWHERARQRRALRRLDAHRLRDIGKSRKEALREAAKPFWRA